jgi:Na+:H+ antiporter, NhaA family
LRPPGAGKRVLAIVRHRRGSINYIVEHSLLLPVGAVAALVWANTAAGSYRAFAHTLEFAVNDIGMVFFFALATKEIVEATAPGGALHTWRRAALPVVAAVGGMVGPALIYTAYVTAVYPPLLRGWAIPCATDIAFSYLVAKFIFLRHPAIPFLLLLAIADDALGLVILALFYPAGDLHLLTAVVLMAAAVAVALALRSKGIRLFWPYIAAGGALSWTALFWGGLHPALALVPVIPFLPRAARDRGLFAEAPPGAGDALSQFERWSKLPVQGVLFLFGLVNAGVQIDTIGTGTWAVMGALLVGKPVGIGVSVAIGVAAGLHLPPRLGWRDVVVTGCAAGIGFTVALFFATAAFPAGRLLDQTKLGALLSVGGAVVTAIVAVVLKVGRFTASREERP